MADGGAGGLVGRASSSSPPHPFPLTLLTILSQATFLGHFLPIIPLPFPYALRLDKGERGHLGVGQLRRFLEQLLQRRYLDSVPAIVPLLERETRNVQVRDFPCADLTNELRLGECPQ